MKTMGPLAIDTPSLIYIYIYISLSNERRKNIIPMQGLDRVLLLLLLLGLLGWATKEAHAAKHTVGGSDGWDVTADLDTWAAGQTFRVGDELVFKYTAGLHTVVELAGEKEYEKCDMSSALDSKKGGNTVVKLDKPGNRYFACGTAGHCDEGMKVKIKTLAANQTASSSPASASSSSSSAFSLGSGSWSLIAVMSVGFGWIALA